MNIRSNNAVYPGIFGAFDEYTVRMNFVNNETGSYLSSKEISPAEDPFIEFETLQARAICLTMAIAKKGVDRHINDCRLCHCNILRDNCM